MKTVKIQAGHAGTPPETSCRNEICTPSERCKKQISLPAFGKAPYIFSVRSRSRHYDHNSYKCNGSNGTTHKTGRFVYQSKYLPFLEQERVYDFQLFSSVWISNSPILQCLVDLEQYFSKIEFVQRFIATLQDKRAVKVFVQHTSFLELQKHLQKRLMTATLLNRGEGTNLVASKDTCSLEKSTNIASRLLLLDSHLQPGSYWRLLLFLLRTSTVKSFSFDTLKQPLMDGSCGTHW